MEPEYKISLHVYPAITIYCADSDRYYWDNDDNEDSGGPYLSFDEAWRAAGVWMMEDV